MLLERFLLDEWFDESLHPEPQWDLGASTGPHWTLSELLDLATTDERAAIDATPLAYSVAAGPEDLRAAIADRHDVRPEDVIVMTGASEALHAIFLGAAEAGANVVVPAPNFPPMSALPRAFGLEVRTYALRRDRRFEIDVDEVADLVDRNTRVVLVNTPNNPTGAVVPKRTMRAVHDIARDVGARFVSDEVYHPLYHGASEPSAAALPEATVVGDMSKAFSLSGLRLGWMIERDRHWNEQAARARMYFTATNSPVSERLALLALRNADTILGRARAVATANLTVLRSFMQDWSGTLDWVAPAGGTVCFPWLVSGDDTRPLCVALRSAGVVVVPGDAFGEPAHIRLGFGGEHDMAGALTAVARVLANSGARPTAQVT